MSESEYDSSDSPTYLRREDSPGNEEDSENEDVSSPEETGEGEAAVTSQDAASQGTGEGGGVTNERLEEAIGSPSEGEKEVQGVEEEEGNASDQESIESGNELESGAEPNISTNTDEIESETKNADGIEQSPGIESETKSPGGMEPSPGIESETKSPGGMEPSPGIESEKKSLSGMEPGLSSTDGMGPELSSTDGMGPELSSADGMEPGPSNIHGTDKGDGESDDELAIVVASTTKQVKKFLKDSDSEDELPGASGDHQEEEAEKIEEGEKGKEKWETLAKSGAMDDVFGESDEEVPVQKRKRATIGDDADEDSPVRKKIRESDDSGSGGEEQLAEVQEEPADQQGEEEGVKETEGGSDDDLEDEDRNVGPSDWDMMMQKRKEAMSRARKRRRKAGDLTINDDHVVAMIRQMQQAAELDRQLNLEGKAATKKLKLLPTVITHLKKTDLQSCFIECGILSALADWLSPLPDQSLPHLRIRENILDVLKAYPIPDSTLLKSSKIGKAVMLLYRHPKEMRKNREKAGKLINEWARPIFGLASDLKSLSRDEREKRDYANLSQAARRRLSSGGESKRTNPDEEFEPQKPGDKGWVGRARVPMPSTNDYVVRPKWNTGHEFKKTPSKKVLNRYEQHVQKSKQKKVLNKATHAVSISVEGRHMPL